MPLTEEILARNNPTIKNLSQHSRSLGDYAQSVVQNGWMTAQEVEDNIRLLIWILERAKLNAIVSTPLFSPDKLEEAIETLLSPKFSEPNDTIPPPLNTGTNIETTFQGMREYDGNIVTILRGVLTDDKDVTEEKVCIAWERMMHIITAYNNGMATKRTLEKQKVRTALATHLLKFSGSWEDLKRTLDEFETQQFERPKTDYEEGTRMDLEIFEGHEEEYVTVQCTDRLVKIYCDMDYIKIYSIHGTNVVVFPTDG